MTNGIFISDKNIGNWKIPAVQFKAANNTIQVPVMGIIANSVPTSETGKLRLIDWKKNIASLIKNNRGQNPWDPLLIYAISIGFSFNPKIHRNQKLDIDNFSKPCIDAVAAGLFCDNDEDPRSIKKYNYDDSNFVYLFVQRLSDARIESEEGAAIFVSASKN